MDASPIGRAEREPPKTPTGISGLDKLTFGGLPTGRPTLQHELAEAIDEALRATAVH